MRRKQAAAALLAGALCLTTAACGTVATAEAATRGTSPVVSLEVLHDLDLPVRILVWRHSGRRGRGFKSRHPDS
ncbi:hypothetical protein AB0I16_06655 [Streptomyces sp. NPDC050703]|uniref:hypothetical protein n=1 Tax=Streptomyces sp. NPDC050703 TaxID=3157218 RepID=UPI00342D7E0E